CRPLLSDGPAPGTGDRSRRVVWRGGDRGAGGADRGAGANSVDLLPGPGRQPHRGRQRDAGRSRPNNRNEEGAMTVLSFHQTNERIQPARRAGSPERPVRRIKSVGPLVLALTAVLGIAFPVSAEDKPAPTVRVAGIVLKWIRGDKEANYRRIEPLIREAAR